MALEVVGHQVVKKVKHSADEIYTLYLDEDGEFVRDENAARFFEDEADAALEAAGTEGAVVAKVLREPEAAKAPKPKAEAKA